MKINEVEIEWLGHSGFLIKNHKVIYIDPFKLSDSELPKADIILITHGHYDHCSIEDLNKIVKPGTTILVNPDSQSKITRLVDKGIEMQLINPGDEIEVKNMRVEAVPAYNPQKQYHPKNEGWSGYLLKFNGLVIYHAGDTDVIPEMQKLSGYGGQKGRVFVALLPIGGTYTMNVEQAIEAVKLIKPDITIPMHWGEIVGGKEDAVKFVEKCKELGFGAELLEKK